MDNCIILITGGKSLIAALATKHKLTGKQVTEININFTLLHFQNYYFFPSILNGILADAQLPGYCPLAQPLFLH